jgi:hypothetical protein
MKISKCCGAEVKQRYMSRTDNVGEMYCTKCDRECEVIESDTIEQPMQNIPTPM